MDETMVPILYGRALLPALFKAIVQYGLFEQRYYLHASNQQQYFDVHVSDVGITATLCSRREYFAFSYMECSVDSLQGRTLYISTLHTGALFDYMHVDHEQKVAFVFQVSDLHPHEHSFNVNTVCTYMEKLQLRQHGYRMRYIYCSSSSQAMNKGCIFKMIKDGKPVAAARRNEQTPGPGCPGYILSEDSIPGK
eukprot:gene29326-38406_t